MPLPFLATIKVCNRRTPPPTKDWRVDIKFPLTEHCSVYKITRVDLLNPDEGVYRMSFIDPGLLWEPGTEFEVMEGVVVARGVITGRENPPPGDDLTEPQQP